ncbi:MAG: Uma2 family endonuclease, partial [Lachnospiraceae bacterium]|nr:Uma2 family endonuclease [Lachnospiraceae bacterium]
SSHHLQRWENSCLFYVKYRAAGVREYWIVNPAKEIVNVYNFEAEEDCNLYSFDDPIPSGIYPGFFICIRELL